MIATLDVEIVAAHPEVPLPTFYAAVGSPSSVRLRNVPRRIGSWNITAVQITVNYPDNQSASTSCVLTGGVWVGTLPASTLAGKSSKGYVITADGVDENGNTVTGYVIGQGDVEITDRDGTVTPGVTTHYAHLLDAVPEKPKKGDMAVSGGVWKMWDGEQWATLGASGDYLVARDVGELPEDPSMTEMKQKINQLVAAMGGRAVAPVLAAFMAAASCFGVEVQTARLGDLRTSAAVVTNVTAETDPAFARWAETNTLVKSETDPTVSAWAKAPAKPSYGWGEITGKPTFAAVATSGAYADLSGRPATVDANVVEGWGFIRGFAELDPTVPAWAKMAQKPSYTPEEVNARPSSWVPTWSEVASKPTFATVAFSGKYADLTGKPTPAAEVTEATVSGWGFVKGAAATNIARVVATDAVAAATNATFVAATNFTTTATNALGVALRGEIAAATPADYTAVSNAAMTAVQTATYYSKTEPVLQLLSGIPIPSVGSGVLVSSGTKYTNPMTFQVTKCDPRVVFEDGDKIVPERLFSEFKVNFLNAAGAKKVTFNTYKNLGSREPPERLSELVFPDEGTIATEEDLHFEITNLEARLTTFTPQDSGKNMLAVTPTGEGGKTETNRLAYVSYVDAATNAAVAAAYAYTDAATNGIPRPAPYVPSAADPTFSNAVLAVALNVDTNALAVLGEIGSLPVTPGQAGAGLGALLAALASAVAWLYAHRAGGEDEKAQAVFGELARMDGFTAASEESDPFDVAITKLSQLLGEDVAA